VPTEEKIKAEVEQSAAAASVALEAARSRVLTKLSNGKAVADYELRTLVEAQYNWEIFTWYVVAIAEEGATPRTALIKVREAVTQAALYGRGQRHVDTGRASSPIGRAMKEHQLDVFRSFVWWANEILEEQ
jgi:hypothetical protein